MENISNAKIEKSRAYLAKLQSELDKSRAKTAEIQTKISNETKHLETLEAYEIAAQYRELVGSEEFAILRKKQKNLKEAEINESVEN